jgi:hypothetical protein
MKIHRQYAMKMTQGLNKSGRLRSLTLMVIVIDWLGKLKPIRLRTLASLT